MSVLCILVDKDIKPFWDDGAVKKHRVQNPVDIN